MKKLISTIGLFSLVVTMSSFTTPGNGGENIIGGNSVGGNVKVDDIIGGNSVGGNVKVDDIIGGNSVGGNVKVD